MGGRGSGNWLAAQKAAQQATADNGNESQRLPETLGDCDSVPLAAYCNILLHKDLATPTGFEPVSRP